TAKLTKITILIDSGQTKSGCYVVGEFRCQARHLQSKRRSLHIRFQWVPGQVGAIGNEIVDVDAKLVAQGSPSPLFDNRTVLASPLPRSKATAIWTSRS
ncbi:hypothetical protein ARMSODRAFT_851112, partial [Armillaria solidipes]